MPFVFLSIDTSAEPANALDDVKIANSREELIEYFKSEYADGYLEWVLEALEAEGGIDTGEDRMFIIKEAN